MKIGLNLKQKLTKVMSNILLVLQCQKRSIFLKKLKGLIISNLKKYYKQLIKHLKLNHKDIFTKLSEREFTLTLFYITREAFEDLRKLIDLDLFPILTTIIV